MNSLEVIPGLLVRYLRLLFVEFGPVLARNLSHHLHCSAAEKNIRTKPLQLYILVLQLLRHG